MSKFDFKSLLGKGGFSAATVQTRTTSVEPEVIAVSTNGKFRLTGAAAAVLMIKAGDYITLINNIDSVNSALANPSDELNAYAQSGVEIDGQVVEFEDATDPQFQEYFRNEAVVWGIAKGWQLYKADGTPLKAKDKVTKEEIDKFIGSKCASNTKVGGIGNQVEFQDSNSWSILKADLIKDGEEENINRVFEVDIKAGEKIEVENGKEMIEVVMYPIFHKEDEKKMARERKEKTEGAEAAEEEVEDEE